MPDNIEFQEIIRDIAENETVLQMKNYKHHMNKTCYEHCIDVSYYSYIISKKFGLDYKESARAGMLHDLFLYNWKGNRIRENGKLHGFSHPKVALKNASELFELSKLEKDIILKHMWPITLAFPRYSESYIVSLVDKFCAIKEYILPWHKKIKFNKLYRYSYMFFALLLFRIN